MLEVIVEPILAGDKHGTIVVSQAKCTFSTIKACPLLLGGRAMPNRRRAFFIKGSRGLVIGGFLFLSRQG